MVDPYHFFSNSRQPGGPALLASRRDETDHGGLLDCLLAALQATHEGFFKQVRGRGEGRGRWGRLMGAHGSVAASLHPMCTECARWGAARSPQRAAQTCRARGWECCAQAQASSL